jgi:separase
VAAEVEAIKSAISSGCASQASITTAQNLLGLISIPNGAPKTSSGTASRTITKGKAPPSRVHKATSRRTLPAKPATAVREDGSPLPPKERYGLATELVNLSLKVLTQAAKARDLSTPMNATPTSTTRTHRRASTISSRSPLQPRSGNVTPSPKTPHSKEQTAVYKQSQARKQAEAHLFATAECCRSAFRYLTSADTRSLGGKELPKWQLETGMLALASRSLVLGLNASGIKVLRAVKSRLEGGAPSSVSKPKSSEQSEDAIIALLLRLDERVFETPDALPLTITYQQLVLKVIASSDRKPTILAAVADDLCLTCPTSPANVIIRHSDATGDKNRAAKQLESLAQTMISLCPRVGSAHDSIACDLRIHPSPWTAFIMQSVALEMRSMARELAGDMHTSAMSDLWMPFQNCLAAFVRRSSQGTVAARVYELAKTIFDRLQSHSTVEEELALFEILKTMALLSEASSSAEALVWLQRMASACGTLEARHVRRTAVLVQSILCAPEPSVLLDQRLPEVAEGLSGRPSGTGNDYDYLLAALARLFRGAKAPALPDHFIDFASRAASFASRCLYPDPSRNVSQKSIIIFALRCTNSLDEIERWISRDVANIFIADGTLKSIAAAADSKSLTFAWSMSIDAVHFGRVLRALFLKAARNSASNPDGDTSMVFFDKQQLAPMERAALLEWQLNYATELAERTKYHAILRKSVPEAFRALSRLYAPEQHPLRRAKVATLALRFHDARPDMLPPHALKIWLCEIPLEADSLADDKRLEGHLEDITANLAIAKAFNEGRPGFAALEPALRAWKGILATSTTAKDLDTRLDDAQALQLQLHTLASYLGMLSETSHQVQVLHLAIDLSGKLEDIPQQTAAAVELAGAYAELGYGEKAVADLALTERLLYSEAAKRSTKPIALSFAKMAMHLAHAECSVAVGDIRTAEQHMKKAQDMRLSLDPESMPREERRQLQALHVRAWLLQSVYCCKKGALHEALDAAKRAVRLADGIWTALERYAGHCDNARTKSDDFAAVIPRTELPEANVPDIQRLTTGVSKLQLTPKDSPKAEAGKPNGKGASFWPLVPLLRKAFGQLSEMYAHHGIFNDADCYTRRAIEITEAVGSKRLLAQALCRRAQLLSLADNIAEAELCLSKFDDLDLHSDASLQAERMRVEAMLRAKESRAKASVRLFDKALAEIEKLCSPSYITTMDSGILGQDEGMPGLALSNVNASEVSEVPVPPAKRTTRTAPKTGRAPGARKTAVTKSTSVQTRTTNGPVPHNTLARDPAASNHPYILWKRQGEIKIEKALICLRSGLPHAAQLDSSLPPLVSTAVTLSRHAAQFHDLMQQAMSIIETDLTYNTLPESTLALPAVNGSTSCQTASSRTGSKAVAARKPPTGVVDQFASRLQDARQCVLSRGADVAWLRFGGTAQIHQFGAMLSNLGILRSAVALMKQDEMAQVVFGTEIGRSNAQLRERQTLAVEDKSNTQSTPYAWPGTAFSTLDGAGLDIGSTMVRTDCIDILPPTWTAVSLTLSENCTELYAGRYKSGRSPLILRLPFARHRHNEDDQEDDRNAFDYSAAKAELKDIIQASNLTCHNDGRTEVKGASSKWWKEREDLDRRLQELVMNVENLWFGGFKGVLSEQHGRQVDAELLSRFRKSFEEVLARHLPSRQSGKGRQESKLLVLDDEILSLFLALGSPDTAADDLDEPLADLLYFVVDMLQFRGERNAYDEIDFDGMTVDMLDALRDFDHDTAVEGGAEVGTHLILVLDKRLQAFPWESLPCLEGKSVSRMPSMLSLRERIRAMRRQRNVTDDAAGYTVSKTSGTYILNPSQDLANTESTLAPPLAELAKNQEGNWTSIVRQAPTEDAFATALTMSPMLLYFGHGSGAQYIRPRKIKKLDRCSEVVWLMGCSSGAVTEYGELEPFAVPLAYLMAGSKAPPTSSGEAMDLETNGPQDSGQCMAVVATLWDVTDKDIDRFSLAMGEEWGLFSPSEASHLPALPTKTPRKKNQFLSVTATPGLMPKTPNPKTPKAGKTPAKTPAARSRSVSRHRKGADGKKHSLVEAVARSREACYLRYLNGAAPVVFGIPVYLED